MKDRDLYSIDEARERLGGISRNSIYQLLHKGQLASVRIGTRRLVSAVGHCSADCQLHNNNEPNSRRSSRADAIQAEARPGCLAFAHSQQAIGRP